MGFDVLKEPWIPVIYKDGTLEEVGILKCLVEADRILSISNAVPYEKIAILRLLTAFVTDVCELENARDREKLFESGKFNEEIIRKYIEECITKYDASFDLLDERRPFLISAYDQSLDFESMILSAAYLHLHLPHGNNIIHTVSQTEDDFAGDTPAEFLRSVLATYLYPTGNMMKGADTKTGALCYKKEVKEDSTVVYEAQYGSMGINAGKSKAAATPVLWWPEGDSLFSTIVMCMRSKKELGNLPLNDPVAPWKSPKQIMGNIDKRGEPVSKVSFVSALTFQSRRVVPIVDHDGKIRKAYISNGYVNPDEMLWHDPFCVRLRNRKTGEIYNLQADVSKMAWRNVKNLTAATDHDWHLMPDVLKPIKKYDEVHYEKIYSLGMVPKTQNAGYEAMTFDDTLQIQEEYMINQELGAFLTKCMEIIEEVSSCWDCLKLSRILGNKSKAAGKYKEDALNEYWSLTHSFLFDGNESFLNQLLTLYQSDMEYEKKALQMLLTNLSNIVKKICEKEEQLTNSWKSLVSVTKCTSGPNGCIHTFNKIRKKYEKEGI